MHCSVHAVFSISGTERFSPPPLAIFNKIVISSCSRVHHFCFLKNYLFESSLNSVFIFVQEICNFSQQQRRRQRQKKSFIELPKKDHLEVVVEIRSLLVRCVSAREIKYQLLMTSWSWHTHSDTEKGNNSVGGRVKRRHRQI